MSEEPIQEKLLTVGREDVGTPFVDWLLARFPRYDRGTLSQLVHVGRAQGLNRELLPETPLIAHETIRLWRPALVSDDPPPALPPVLFEDDRVIVLDKPAGMLVHPAGSSFVWAMVGLVRLARPGTEIHLAHRLDRDTSGVLVLAKDELTNRSLKESFRLRSIEKRYLAIVRGRPAWDLEELQAPIGRHPDSAIRLKMAVRDDGQPATTIFRVLARFTNFTLVECEPKTGRTHQIRVHLDYLGHPLVGDRIYGQPEALFLHVFERGFDDASLRCVGLPRQALHARSMRIPQSDGATLDLVAPLPEDLRALLRQGVAPPLDPSGILEAQGRETEP